MDLSPSTRAAMVDAIPKLRRFALGLCRNASRADDLVQETLLRACTNIAQFRPGTAMGPWLTTILRNQYYSEHRRHHREISDPDGIYAGALVAPPEQIPCVEMAELNGALARLPAPLREAIVMVGAGYSYDEAARNCGCADGDCQEPCAQGPRAPRVDALVGGRRGSRAPVTVSPQASRVVRRVSVGVGPNPAHAACSAGRASRLSHSVAVAIVRRNSPVL